MQEKLEKYSLFLPALEQSTVFLPPDHLQVHLGSPGHISAALADDTRNKKKTNILPTVYLAAPLCKIRN